MRHGHERELKANNCEFLSCFLLLHSERRTDDELEEIADDNDLFIRSELVVFTLHQIIAQNQWNDLISLKLYLTSSCISNIEITLLLEGLACPNSMAKTRTFQKLEVKCIYVYITAMCMDICVYIYVFISMDARVLEYCVSVCDEILRFMKINVVCSTCCCVSYQNGCNVYLNLFICTFVCIFTR
jgi:hypothetical protein